MQPFTFIFSFQHVKFLCTVVEIKSDATLPEAVEILAHHNILSAPVVDVNAPEGSTWIDRYIGIVEFAGIVVWILQQVSIPSYLRGMCQNNWENKNSLYYKKCMWFAHFGFSIVAEKHSERHKTTDFSHAITIG